MLALVLWVAGLAAAPAHAASPLSWSQPASADSSGKAPTAISCPSVALCVAVDRGGNVLTTVDPTSGVPTWHEASIDGQALSAISCATATLCLAVDGGGRALASSNPSAGGGSWSSPAAIPGAGAMTGISCPTPSLCIAVDSTGHAFATSNPGPSAGWSSTPIDAPNAPQAISCSSGSLCVAVDSSGGAIASQSPGAGSGWRRHAIDPTPGLTAISCAPAGYCVAVDSGGDELTTVDPGAGAPTWSATPIDPGSHLAGVSCASSGLCVAVDERGAALASDNVAAATPAWEESNTNAGRALAAVSCLPAGLCVAIDTFGRSFGGRVQPPGVATTAPTEVTATTATLSGLVNPNDAEISSCTFEYGPSSSYGQSVPCASLPTPAGGAQAVSAQIGGLAPNSTYHYRLLASSLTGMNVGGDQAFTAAVSTSVALVHPHPSLHGTPAIGARLSCQTGIASGSSARISLAWLRDLIPIPGVSGSSYVVRGVDGGRHLQCQVTTTNAGGSATARSAFVTIPLEGLLAAAGETTVGRARLRGAKVSVPVRCSSEAPGGCRVLLRLTTVGRPPVTVGATRVRLAQGQFRIAFVPLNAAGRRLLARHRAASIRLSVSGTVIGVIESLLSQQRLTLGSRSRRASSHRASHRRAARLDGRSAAGSRIQPLATSPYMGWDTYFAFGGHYSEATILRQASELLTLGLQRDGYRYVWLDVGWWQGARGPGGEIVVSHRQWPHGLQWLTATLHAAGLLAGIYTDAGRDGCGGAGQGSGGHYQQDVNTLAAWGFDAVKVDFCGGSEEQLNPASAYGAFHAAIAADSPARPMLLSICNFLQPGQYAEGEPTLEGSAFSSYTFGPSLGNSWRTDTDVGAPGHVSFTEVLRNMDADAAAPQAAGPGHWNDPDYLGPDQGLSVAQFRTQFSMWAMLAAPLMISTDLSRMTASSRATVSNLEAIAIDQDHAGVQGRLMSSSGSGEVWVKPLGDGSRAVALLNRGSVPARLETSAAAIGMPAASAYLVRNVWAHTTVSVPERIAARVPGDSTVLVRVSPSS